MDGSPQNKDPETAPQPPLAPATAAASKPSLKDRVVGLGKLTLAAAKDWSEDDASGEAAKLSYYALFSMAPVAVLLTSVMGAFFGDEAARGAVSRELTTYVGADAASMIQEAVLASAPERDGATIATIVSVALLVFGATKVFMVLQGALNRIWEVEADHDGAITALVTERITALGMILGLCFILLVSTLLSTTLSVVMSGLGAILPGSELFWTLGNLGITAGVYVVMFGLLFKLVPDVEIEWRHTWFGAGVTSALFMLGQWALSYYLATNSTVSAYGAAGAVLSLLVWVNYSGQIVFFGAELTQQWACRQGEDITPSPHAKWRAGARGARRNEDTTTPQDQDAHMARPLPLITMENTNNG